MTSPSRPRNAGAGRRRSPVGRTGARGSGVGPGHVRGPLALGLAWLAHDLEEVAAFPATSRRLAARLSRPELETDLRRSAVAVGLMGVLVTTACVRGARSGGSSRLYRAVVAGLGAHVVTHLAACVALGGYAAGAISALPIMAPGARIARRELAARGHRLTTADTLAGAALLVPGAAACHLLARLVPPMRP